MKSLFGKFASVRGWAPLLTLLLGAGLLVSACGDEDVPAPTTPAPAPAPAPAPPPEPEPTGPAVPTGLTASASTATSITWSWNAVEGALGYQGQFSPDAEFTAADPTYVIVAPMTSHKVENLKANTTGYFRVRSGAGTSLTELTYSYWSDASTGTTGAAPAPPPATKLSSPSGVTVGTRERTSISLSWSEVSDADTYEVEEQPADGSWVAANCGSASGSNQVSTTSCVASGLTEGTDYNFRVRAVPASSDTTKAASDWSSTVAAKTAGSPPAAPITGGDDEYEITWESTRVNRTAVEPTKITWTWSRPDDGRIRFLLALSKTGSDPSRPACPSITVSATGNIPSADDEFGTGDAATHGKWYGGPSGLALYSYAVSGLKAGDVRQLCVVPTWMDADKTPQFGTVFFAWASTPPRELVNASDPDSPGVGKSHHNPTASGGVGYGPKDKSNDTTAIDWYFQTDQGFTYEVETVSAGIDSAAPTCSGDRSGLKRFAADVDNKTERYRRTSLTDYTRYVACARATNDQGVSDWTELPAYLTLPSAPGLLSGSSSGVIVGTSKVTGKYQWSFQTSDTTPEAPSGYDVVVFRQNAPVKGGARPPDSVVSKCGNPATSETVINTLAVTDSGSGMTFELTGLDFSREAGDGRADYTIRMKACVRAETTRGNIAHFGPWQSGSGAITVSAQKQ